MKKAADTVDSTDCVGKQSFASPAQQVLPLHATPISRWVNDYGIRLAMQSSLQQNQLWGR